MRNPPLWQIFGYGPVFTSTGVHCIRVLSTQVQRDVVVLFQREGGVYSSNAGCRFCTAAEGDSAQRTARDPTRPAHRPGRRPPRHRCLQDSA